MRLSNRLLSLSLTDSGLVKGYAGFYDTVFPNLNIKGR